jgi:hypothetical protein
MKLLSSGISLLVLVEFVFASTNDDGSSFEQLKTWLASEGAEVNEAMKGSVIDHGGANIRGVITIKDLAD